METLADVRKAIKPLGFTFNTKSLSWGLHATYKHIDTGDKLTFNVAPPETWNQWKPLLDWRKENKEQLKVVRENEDCRGLV
jgi:hypothetical protein